jgi:hypothetical protein
MIDDGNQKESDTSRKSIEERPRNNAAQGNVCGEDLLEALRKTLQNKQTCLCSNIRYVGQGSLRAELR